MSEGGAHGVSSDTGRTYELLGELGRGGFGAVYKGRHTGDAGFTRLVAIKMLNDDSATRPEYANRLRDEARLLARLRHRVIVAVDDLVCLDGRWAVVMEYVEGEDLLNLIRLGPVPPRAAVEIAMEVASGLRVIHAAKDPTTKRLLGIVHRDLKPGNIRITPHGEVKLLDFGIARAAFPGREAITGSVRFESVGYVAPERMLGLDSAGSDIFSLGVVLWECLTGERMGPLPERQGAYEAAVARALDHLDQILQDGGRTRAVLERMLAFEDRERPTAQLTCDLLRDLTQELTGPWLATWAPDLLGRSRYGDPEDYSSELGPAAPARAPQDPSSTESLAVPIAPDPAFTVGKSLPLASRQDGAPAEPSARPTEEPPPESFDALVPAEEDEELEAPIPAPRSLPPPPPAPRPPPEPVAPAPAKAPPPLAPVPMSSALPPMAGWFLGTAALLLLIGVLGTALYVRFQPQEPTEPTEQPPVAQAPTIETAPVEVPTTQQSPPEAPVEAPSTPAEGPQAPTEAPAEVSAPAQTVAPVTQASASGGAKTSGATRERPRGGTKAAKPLGRVQVRGTYDKAELVAPGARFPVGDVPPGTYRLRVRFGKDLDWVETGLSVSVVENQTVTIACSYESEACRISQ